MRIVENRPERLVLRDRTLWVSAVVILGAAMAVLNFAQHPHALPLLPVALAGAFACAVALFALRSSDVVFDKRARTCRVRRLDMLKLTRRSLAFDDIQDVRVDVSLGSGVSAISCRLALVTSAGELPLTAAFEPGELRYDVMREALAEVVFDRKPRPPPPDPLEGLMRAGRYIDAIALLRRRDGLDLTEAKARVDALRAAGTSG